MDIKYIYYNVYMNTNLPETIPDDLLATEWGQDHAESVRLYAGISAKAALEVAMRNSSDSPDQITEEDNQLMSTLAKEVKSEYSQVVIPNAETNLRLFRGKLSDQEEIVHFFGGLGIEKDSLDLSPGTVDNTAFINVLERLDVALKAQETGSTPNTFTRAEQLLWVRNAKDPSGLGFVLDSLKYQYALGMGLLDETILNKDEELLNGDNLQEVLDKINLKHISTLPDQLRPDKSNFSSMLFAAELLEAGMAQSLNEVYKNLEEESLGSNRTGSQVEDAVDNPETLATAEVIDLSNTEVVAIGRRAAGIRERLELASRIWEHPYRYEYEDDEPEDIFDLVWFHDIVGDDEGLMEDMKIVLQALADKSFFVEIWDYYKSDESDESIFFSNKEVRETALGLLDRAIGVYETMRENMEEIDLDPGLKGFLSVFEIYKETYMKTNVVRFSLEDHLLTKYSLLFEALLKNENFMKD